MVPDSFHYRQRHMSHSDGFHHGRAMNYLSLAIPFHGQNAPHE